MKANLYVREIEAVFKPSKGQKKVKIKRSKDAYQLFCDMEDATQEKLIALHLAGDSAVLCFQVVHIGSINFAVINSADILRTALLTGATSLIVLHNHPSGDPTPSPEDKKMVQQVKQACDLLQFKLFDSIIIGKDKYFSAADEGQL